MSGRCASCGAAGAAVAPTSLGLCRACQARLDYVDAIYGAVKAAGTPGAAAALREYGRAREALRDLTAAGR